MKSLEQVTNASARLDLRGTHAKVGLLHLFVTNLRNVIRSIKSTTLFSKLSLRS